MMAKIMHVNTTLNLSCYALFYETRADHLILRENESVFEALIRLKDEIRAQVDPADLERRPDLRPATPPNGPLRRRHTRPGPPVHGTGGDPDGRPPWCIARVGIGFLCGTTRRRANAGMGLAYPFLAQRDAGGCRALRPATHRGIAGFRLAAAPSVAPACSSSAPS